MPARSALSLSHVLAHLPGWLFLLGGITLIAQGLLTPAWLDCRALDWQKQVLGDRTANWENVESSTQRFREALVDHDPVLLERLAYDHLRLRPIGANLLDQPGNAGPLVSIPDGLGDPGFDPDTEPPTPHPPQPQRSEIMMDLAVEPRWIMEEISRAENPSSIYPIDSIMVRLTTGTTRLFVIGIGILCTVSGLVWSPPTKGTFDQGNPVQG